MKRINTIHKAILASGMLLLAAPDLALAAASGGGLEEIVITARKRDETSLSAPVVVTAVGAKQLERLAVTNLDGVARLVPQLMIGAHGGAVQGGIVSMRGIAGPSDNPFGDQAVSFNVDGVAIGKSSVRRMADIDLERIEVLKGPQALFYGKNSPGGIISIRTADPTPNWEAKISGGYEFVAREWRGEGYVSGPINEKVGIRIAGLYSDMKGYLKNDVPANTYLASTSFPRSPKQHTFSTRLTLKFEANDRFDGKLKFNYGKYTNPSGPADFNEFVVCPYGARQTGSGGPCKASNHIIVTGTGAVAGAWSQQAFRDGHAYQDQDQILTSLELNYHVSDNILLTSVTGYYQTKLNQAGQYESDWAVALPSNNFLKQREFSQELRMTTSYDGLLNFSGGLYYADTFAQGGSLTLLYASDPLGVPLLSAVFGFPVPPLVAFPINDYDLEQHGKAYSAYLQMIIKPVEKIEIDLGGRFSHEAKRMAHVYTSPIGVFPLTAANSIPINPTKKDWDDFSPEVTVTYRPTNQLTLFASYKYGFLSGGFNSAAVDYTLSPDISYNPEKIHGFEGGIKALVLNNTLRLNLAGYTYKMYGLQLANYVNATNTIRNAGGAKIDGVEFDFTWSTPLQGLSLNGAAAYNKAKFSKYVDNAPCYNGQTIAMGCNIIGGVPLQNLNGTPLPRAPKLNLSGGFNFDREISDRFKIGLTGGVTYSSKYFTDASSSPTGVSRPYTLIDASVRFGDIQDRWMVELIGRNLTDRYYYQQTNDVPFTGSAQGGVTGTLGDRYANVSRGREVMLRLSYKFGR